MRFLKTLCRFRNDERGSSFIIVGLGIMALIGAGGSAMDVGRAELVQAKLSSSLDAAGLAAGATVSTSNLESEVNKYLNANFQNYLGSSITDVDININSDNTIITLEAAATIPTTVMKIFGYETINVKASAEITRATSGLELVMVLDNTGSMAGADLVSLKSAANSLVNILYGDNPTVDDLWIGLVPFAQAVNIGSARTAWTAPNAFNWGPTSWAGCVDARETGGRDSTDEPPNVSIPESLFPQYYWPDDGNNDWTSIGNQTVGPTTTTICSRNSSCTCGNYGPCTTTTNTVGNVTTTTTISCSGSGNNRSCTRRVTVVTSGVTLYNITSLRTPNKYCSQAITPLTNNKTTITNGINAMTTDGNTHVNLGAVWGWRMLSPRWRGLWGGDMDANQLPLNYNTPKMNKAAIIMTDGENTMSNSSRTAYWYLNDGKLGSTNSTIAVNNLNSRLSQVCTSMKNNNIIVYTIAFGSPGSTIQNLLRNCATQPDFYFDSPDATTLENAFKQIGDSLSSLRVSK